MSSVDQPVASDGVAVREAATVMLLRDREPEVGGFDVFMMRRTSRAVFATGMWVFPGGAVDEADRSSEAQRWCAGFDDAQASARLGIDSGGGLAYWVAAVRECFEEAGVLLAVTAGGAAAEPNAADRAAVYAGSLSLFELCARDGLVINVADIAYVAHWITPKGETPKRFDTRFFLARVPAGQEPLHDDGETVASEWITPADALAKAESGEYTLMPPTVYSLRWLTEFDTVDAAIAGGHAITRPPAILPRITYDANARMNGLVFPWDDDYPRWE